MRGRPNLAVLAAVCFLFGISCALNPQPEPPFSSGSSSEGSPQNPNGGLDLASDAGVAIPGVRNTADGGVNGRDSSIMSDASNGNVGSVEAGATEDGAADAAPESSSAADATQEGATTAD